MPVIDSPEGRIFSADPLGVEEQGPFYDEGVEAAGQQELDALLSEMSTFLSNAFQQYDGSSLRKEVLETAKEAREAYRQKAEDTNFPWPSASNMITPLTRVAVDELEPRLVQSLVGREPYLRVKHYPGASTKEQANDTEDYINYVLSKEVKLFVVTSKMIHKTLLDGTVFPMPYWVRSDSPPFDGPKVMLVPLEHVWMADDVDDEDWEEATVFRYVDEFTPEQLLARAQQEEGWIQSNLPAVATGDKELTGEQELRAVTKEEVTETAKTLEAFFTYGGQRWIALLDKDSFKILRLRLQSSVSGANIKPVRRFCLFREEGVSWGDSIYDAVRGVQEGMDGMWNRCVNSADITMTPWGFYKKGLSGAQTRLQIHPGALFASDDPQAYSFPNLGMFKPTEFVPLIQIYQTFWQRLTVSDFMQGMESELAGKKGTTATGTLAIIQEGKIKNEYRGTLAQFSFLDLMLVIYNMIAENMPQEDVQPVTGKPVLQMTLAQAYQFDLGPSTATANRFVDRKETEDFMMVMQPFMSLLNPIALLNDILRSYGKRPEEYIDPELNQIVQQYLAIKENTKALVAMGIPEQVAQQLSQKGITPDNVQQYFERVGEEHGKAAAEASLPNGGVPPSEQGEPAEAGS